MPYERLQGFIADLQLRFRQKGEERLTIMIIPHGQDRIFSLQLNWYMILFLTGTALLAVALAFYGVYLQAIESREVDRLRRLYGLNFNYALELKSNSVENRLIHGDLRLNLERIAETLGTPESDLSALPEEEAADEQARAGLQQEARANRNAAPRAGYLPPVYSLKALRNSIINQSPLMGALAEAFNGGFGIYSQIPLGRPFRDMRLLQDTSGYGVRSNPFSGAGYEFHSGYDTSGPYGTPIFATGAGVVHRVSYGGDGYGQSVVIYHDNGFYSMFAHLSETSVRTGQRVRRGDRVGAMGSSGRATGVHLHYEVWIGDSSRVDPWPFVCARDFASPRCTDYHRRYSD